MGPFFKTLEEAFYANKTLNELEIPVQRVALTLPDNTEVILIDESHLREQIAKEIEASQDAYVHEDAFRTEDGRWPGLKVIPIETAIAIARGQK